MAVDNLRKLVDRSVGIQEEQGSSHSMTVKLPQRTYAKLRALVDLVGRPKTPFASDILVAAIDDFIENLPAEPVNDPVLEEKLLGVTLDLDDPYTLSTLVGWATDRQLQDDAREAENQEKQMVSSIEAQLSGRNGSKK
jgi:hypothetical protein